MKIKLKQRLRKKGRKIINLNRNKHEYMRIPDRICQNNKKLFVTVNQKNSCELGFGDNLWLPFFGQPRSDVLVFSIISFQMYI